MQTLLESRYVTAMGVRFHYLTAGKGAPVLLLHGFPENCRSFDGNAEALIDAGFELYIPDLKGYGLSDRPTPGTPGGDYRLSRVSQEIGALIQALGHSQVSIVGHDWGGAILSAMMLSCPQRIARAVIMNAPFRRFLPHKTRHFYKFNIPHLPEQLFERDPHRFLRGIFDYWCASPGTYLPAEIDQYVRAFETQKSFHCALAYYRALPRDVSFYIRGFQMKVPTTGAFPPTLVLFGAEDPILPPTVARWAHEDIKGSLLHLIDGAGHFVHREAPGQVNEQLISFLGAGTP